MKHRVGDILYDRQTGELGFIVTILDINPDEPSHLQDFIYECYFPESNYRDRWRESTIIMFKDNIQFLLEQDGLNAKRKETPTS